MAEHHAAFDESDKDSDILSEIDEEQFQDLEDERPKEIDEDVLKSLKPARKKVVEGEAPKKKPKFGRLPKKRARADDDEVDAANIADGVRRPRKSVAGAAPRARRQATPEEDLENLTPEERRRRVLDNVMDQAARGTKPRRRKKDGIDLEEQMDEQIASLKVRMEQACVADNEARNKSMLAVHKLQLLPEVTAMLSRTQIQDSVLDPDVNFLQSVKYFLEPLDDGSLPAYNIQRDIFTALQKLPINKDMLLDSGIGKVVLFYTKSKRASQDIKRIAERLVGEWSRPILKRTDDYKKRQVETRDFDSNAADRKRNQEAVIGGSQLSLSQRPAPTKSKHELERERLLAPEPSNSNRARLPGLPTSYTVAPQSTFNVAERSAVGYRPIGAAGTEAFRKMTQKGKGGSRR